jgi:ferric-dicitrate binding protein FerR (iron transport regulator)
VKPEELDRLIHRYFEGDLSPEEEGLLWSVVRIDPSAADRFVELSELESAMVESLRAEEAAPPEVRGTRRASRRTRVLAAPAVRRPVWVLFLAAGLMIGFLALLLTSTEQPHRSDIAKQAESPKPAPAPQPLPVPPDPVQPKPIAPAPVDVPRPAPRPAPVPAPVDVPKPIEPTPLEPKPPQPPIVTPPERSAVTETKIADVEVEGDVVDDRGIVVKTGQAMVSGQGLDVRKGSAKVTLADRTQVELRPDTRLDRIVAAPDQMRLVLSRGLASSTVTKQQPGKTSVVFQTPHAEVTVLGTKLTIHIGKDTTQVDVQEGRVRCKRLPDGATTEIAAGRFAVAGKGLLLSSRPIPIVQVFQDGVAPTPDYRGTTDTMISSANPTGNFGKIEQLQLQRLGGQQSALIRWDLSSIPVGSRVVSAEITFWVTGKLVGDCKVYALNLPFEESEASYKSARGNLLWRTQGAQSDQDRGTAPISALAPEKPGFHTAFLDVNTVQTWVNAPTKNFGILIAGPDANIWGLEARETAVPDRRPRITITFISGK